MDEFLKQLGLLLFRIGAGIFSLFIATKVWHLVIVPMGAQELTMLRAWGLAMLASLFDSYDSFDQERTDEQKFKGAIYHMIGSLATWGLASLIF